MPNRIKELREKGVTLSQEHIGVLLGYEMGLSPFSPATISKQENGIRGLSKDQIEAYSKIFRVDSYELFLDPEELPDHNLD